MLLISTRFRSKCLHYQLIKILSTPLTFLMMMILVYMMLRTIQPVSQPVVGLYESIPTKNEKSLRGTGRFVWARQKTSFLHYDPTKNFPVAPLAVVFTEREMKNKIDWKKLNGLLLIRVMNSLEIFC
jgi:hypothetical protein